MNGDRQYRREIERLKTELRAAKGTIYALTLAGQQDLEKIKRLESSRDETAADCPDCMKCLEQEERAMDYADQLANMVGVLVGQDMGEHSSENEPWVNAIEALRVAIGSKQSPVETTHESERLALEFRLASQQAAQLRDDRDQLRTRHQEAFRIINAATYYVPQPRQLHAEIVAWLKGASKQEASPLEHSPVETTAKCEHEWSAARWLYECLKGCDFVMDAEGRIRKTGYPYRSVVEIPPEKASEPQPGDVLGTARMVYTGKLPPRKLDDEATSETLGEELARKSVEVFETQKATLPLCDCDPDFGCKEYGPTIFRCCQQEMEKDTARGKSTEPPHDIPYLRHRMAELAGSLQHALEKDVEPERWNEVGSLLGQLNESYKQMVVRPENRKPEHE
jgi:hypothetical protein